jgi:hypothetical protein
MLASSMKPIAGSDCASDSRSSSIFAPPRMCSISFLGSPGRPAGLVRDRTAIRPWTPQENPCRADRCRDCQTLSGRPHRADPARTGEGGLSRRRADKRAIPRSGRRFQISWPASSQHWSRHDHSAGVTCPKHHEHDGTARRSLWGSDWFHSIRSSALETTPCAVKKGTL